MVELFECDVGFLFKLGIERSHSLGGIAQHRSLVAAWISDDGCPKNSSHHPIRIVLAHLQTVARMHQGPHCRDERSGRRSRFDPKAQCVIASNAFNDGWN